MKVVQVLPALDGGGVERGTLEIAKGLVDAGHESIVISAGGRMVSQLEAEGSRHVEWDLGKKSPLTFRHIWALRRWLKKEKPDILHLRSRMPAWVCWFAWKGLPETQRPHLVTTVHGLYSVNRYSAIMCRGERVIAVSNTVRDYIRDNYPGTDMEKVEVIYRGIDPDEFPHGYHAPKEWLNTWYSEYPFLRDKIILTLPGRLTRLKGHHDFIGLIQELKIKGFSVHGLIVGGSDPKRQKYFYEIQEKIKELGLDDFITFTGSRNDMREIYAISDLVFSLSTQPESFGRTVVEALNVGVPVVGYDHGGVGEILNAVFPEGCVKLKNRQELIKKTINIIENIRLAYGFINNEYGKEDMLNKTLSIYRSLV